MSKIVEFLAKGKIIPVFALVAAGFLLLLGIATVIYGTEFYSRQITRDTTIQLLREQERALILVVRIQPLQVEAVIGTVSRRHRPGPPVARDRIVEPAVGDLLGHPCRHPFRPRRGRHRNPEPASA